MADWIWCAMSEKNLSAIEIDILNKTVAPKDLEIKQITTYLERLQETIKKELTGNGFQNDFIASAKFEIFITENHKIRKRLNCVAVMTDSTGKIYKSKKYSESSYMENLKVFSD